MRAYLFVLLVACAVTYLTTPAARRLARRVGAVAPIRERDVHTVPIPRLGGTAIFLGVAIAMLMASQVQFFHTVFFHDKSAYAVLLSACAVCLLGVFDDIWQLDAVTKLAGQALASGVMAWQGIQLVSLPIFGTFIPSRGLLTVITVIAIVVTINAVNFVDGLDGLAAGMVAIAGSAFFIYSYLLTKELNSTDYSSLASLIIAALVGACVGFLPHNFNPARIFMGDSGSMLIGLLLATCTVAITGTVQPAVLAQTRIVPAFIPLVLPLAVLALPLIDLALAVIRRTRAGKMFWVPDKMHLHHRMLGLGHSHARAVLILYIWTAAVGFGVALFALVSPFKAVLIGGTAIVIALVLTIGPSRRARPHHGGGVVVVATGPSASGAASEPEPEPVPVPAAGPVAAPTPMPEPALNPRPAPPTGTAPSTAPETRPAGIPIATRGAGPASPPPVRPPGSTHRPPGGAHRADESQMNSGVGRA